MSKYFNSQYPIIEAAMNRVSDLPLALACWEAGIFPSLVVSEFVQFDTVKKDYDRVDSLLKEFVHCTGSANLVFSVGIEHLFDRELMCILKSHQVSHLEIYAISNPRGPTNDWDSIKTKLGTQYNAVIAATVKNLQPMKIMYRRRNPEVSPFDFAYCLKGSDSAGSSADGHTTREIFEKQIALTPGGILIPYGGVGTPTQVAEYINLGATAVGVGTLFAASAESSLSQEAKQALIDATQVEKLPDTQQNAVLLGNREQVLADRKSEADWNRENALEKGIQGNGKTGLIYAGAGIKYITKIRKVSEIVEYLTSELVNIHIDT
jgi:NAD(P)H-dependent flavin oxidoreductase YrpB (nitropropane dioxygenase family)